MLKKALVGITYLFIFSFMYLPGRPDNPMQGVYVRGSVHFTARLAGVVYYLCATYALPKASHSEEPTQFQEEAS